MNLESVRELKRSLQEQLLAKLATTVQARSALGEAAHGLGTRRAAPPTLALGVARRERNQFALAVRVQQRALEHSRTVEDLTKLAKGEVDVRYIGLVEKRAGPVSPRSRISSGSNASAPISWTPPWRRSRKASRPTSPN